MHTGRPSRTYATSEFVVPRSMPIGFGFALGSKISNSISKPCQLVFRRDRFAQKARRISQRAEQRNRFAQIRLISKSRINRAPERRGRLFVLVLRLLHH